MKQISNILIGALLALFLLIGFKKLGCNGEFKLDPEKVALKNQVAFLQQELQKADEVAAVAYQLYDSTAAVNDSLSKETKKVVVKYRTVREKGDTIEIVKTCDELALKADSLAAANDSLKTSADLALATLTNENLILKKLNIEKDAVIVDKDRVSLQLEEQVKALKKLADRRGRKLEW